MYSYDVSASPGRSATASRSIPGMRPSYDAEHPHSATPIYDELYSEYRRLFRALPGDRSGEEDLKFTGFAVRDGYPLLGEQQQQPYPPQQQAFHTLAGQVPGLPQFMPGPQQHGSGPTGGQQHGHTGTQSHGHSGAHSGAAHANIHTNTHTNVNNHTGGHPGTHAAGSRLTGRHHGHSVGQAGGHSSGHSEPTVTAPTHPPTHTRSPTHAPSPAPVGDGPGHPTPAPAQDQPALSAAQFTNGQGWVASGYLGAAPHPLPVPAPPPPAPPAPAPVMGTVDGLAPTRPAGGRHRQMLSLPPGPTADHR